MPLPGYIMIELLERRRELADALQREAPNSERRDEMRERLIALHNFIVREEKKAERDPWGEDPEYSRADWCHVAGDNDTSLGYWDWVDRKREIDSEDEET